MFHECTARTCIFKKEGGVSYKVCSECVTTADSEEEDNKSDDQDLDETAFMIKKITSTLNGIS